MSTSWYVSDCGEYLARRRGGGSYDVFSIDGERCWLAPRYRAKSWEDEDPRFTYPEFAHMVGCYGTENKWNGQWRFTLGWSDHDQSLAIDPGKGNTITKRYKASFSRRYKMRPAKPIRFDDEGRKIA